MRNSYFSIYWWRCCYSRGFNLSCPMNLLDSLMRPIFIIKGKAQFQLEVWEKTIIFPPMCADSLNSTIHRHQVKKPWWKSIWNICYAHKVGITSLFWLYFLNIMPDLLNIFPLSGNPSTLPNILKINVPHE